MCGIVGVVGPDVRPGRGFEALVASCAAALRHRGPDDEGAYVADGVAFGHTRLSIIDLSSGGHQPMFDETRRYALVYNGEIYNYRELRAELQALGRRFRTASDSEVLLAAYVEWGASCLTKLNGMWAFAIWDAERRELFAARDRAGKKPFYFARDEAGRLWFASEVKALARVGFRFTVEPQAAFDFITQGTYGHLGERTFFDGLRQLPAAHSLVACGDSPVRVTRYWDLPAPEPSDRLPYDGSFRARFRELFYDAVSLRLRSDVAVGATLSGGLDSSSIVLAVDELTGGAPLELFTSQYPGSGHDETPYVNAVLARLRQPRLHTSVPEASDFQETLLRCLDHQEEPFGDTSILAHFTLMRAAREAHVPVILSGQGGDELLLGYPSMVNAYLGHLFASRQLAQGWREARAWAAGQGRSAPSVVRQAMLHTLPMRARDLARRPYLASRATRLTARIRRLTHRARFNGSARGGLDAYLHEVFTRFALPHLVHYDDRNAMAFAIEGRMPFLDYRLAELLSTVEYSALFADGLTKRVLRDVMRDRLPPEILERRDKIGFYTPLARWMREQRSWLTSFMSDERVRDVGVLDASKYERTLRAFLAGDDRGFIDVWRGFILHLWMDRFEVAPSDDSHGREVMTSRAAVPVEAGL